MSITFQSEITLATDVCCRCGITFAMPKDFQAKRRRDGSEFFCPNGHTLIYPGESDADKIKRLEREAAAQRDMAQTERQRRHQAEKDAADAQRATAAAPSGEREAVDKSTEGACKPDRRDDPEEGRSTGEPVGLGIGNDPAAPSVGALTAAVVDAAMRHWHWLSTGGEADGEELSAACAAFDRARAGSETPAAGHRCSHCGCDLPDDLRNWTDLCGNCEAEDDVQSAMDRDRE